MTVAAALATTARAVAGVSDAPALEATRLLEYVLGQDRAWLVVHAKESLDAEAGARLESLVAQRLTGMPLAYVVGEGWFYGRGFILDENVLVPRPESEHVVEAAIGELQALVAAGRTAVRACDVGTGSGAIGLTLAAELAALTVYLSDVSETALVIAGRNAARLGITDRVRFVAGDLAVPLLAFGPYDCVVANLPYVPSSDVPLAPDPVGFEPRLAVDGGDDGLALYRRLLPALPRLLAPGASAFLEAAPPTIEKLAAIAATLPGAYVEVGEDYAGLERWVALSFPEGGADGAANPNNPI